MSGRSWATRFGLAAEQARVKTRDMTDAADHPGPTGARPEAQDYRHLPEMVSLEDTVESMRGDSPPEAGGEPNQFIAAAINAGG